MEGNPTVGLYNTQTNAILPIIKTEISGTIIDLGTELIISQEYKNDKDYAVEVVYNFVIPNQFVVNGLELVLDDNKVITAVCEAKIEAQGTYDDAIAAGNASYLIEMISDTALKLNLSSIPPHKSVIIRIHLIAELGSVDDTIRFFIPASIIPNLTSAAAQSKLEIKLSFEMPSKIRNLYSPSHSIEQGMIYTMNANKGSLQFSDHQRCNLLQDFLVHIQTESLLHSRAWTTVDHSASMLILHPQLEASASASALSLTVPPVRTPEFIFLIDRSGSMGGNSIQSAKGALRLFLKSLPQDCYFNIISFGDSYNLMFPDPVVYNDENLESALEQVSYFEADYGGTELKQPLEDVFNCKCTKVDRFMQVFILTDGQVQNIRELQQFVSCYMNAEYRTPKVVSRAIQSNKCTFTKRDSYARQFWYRFNDGSYGENLNDPTEKTGCCLSCFRDIEPSRLEKLPVFGSFYCDVGAAKAEHLKQQKPQKQQKSQNDKTEQDLKQKVKQKEREETQEWNEEQIQKMMQQWVEDPVRIFTVGIGADYSFNLVMSLAQLGKGTSEHVKPGQSIEAKIIKQLSFATRKSTDDYQLKFNFTSDCEIPDSNTHPSLFDAKSQIFYRLNLNSKPSSQNLNVEVQMNRKNNDSDNNNNINNNVEQTNGVEVIEFKQTETGSRIVELLAVKARIEYLEKQKRKLNEEPVFRNNNSVKESQEVKLIVEELKTLGRQFHLVNSEVSLVLVEQRSESTLETPVLLQSTFNPNVSYPSSASSSFESQLKQRLSAGCYDSQDNPSRHKQSKKMKLSNNNNNNNNSQQQTQQDQKKSKGSKDSEDGDSGVLHNISAGTKRKRADLANLKAVDNVTSGGGRGGDRGGRGGGRGGRGGRGGDRGGGLGGGRGGRSEPERERERDSEREQEWESSSNNRSRGGWREVIEGQKYDGRFELQPKLLFKLGLTMEAAKQGLLTFCGEQQNYNILTLWATALVLAWLEKYASTSAQEWEMVAEKSKQWMKRHLNNNSNSNNNNNNNNTITIQQWIRNAAVQVL